MKLIALKKISRTLPKGQVFEIRDKEAKSLIVLRLAKPFEAGDETAVDVEAAIDAPRPRRRYQRRDLTAAD